MNTQTRISNSATATKTRGTCLHIGCGLNTPIDWENIDASPSLRISQVPIIGRFILSRNHGPNWSNRVGYGDIVKGLKGKDNSCELIFAAHVLEHLSYADFHVAVKNIYQYLQPGGTFRFIVPDLRYYIDTYIQQFNDQSRSPQAAQHFLEESLIGCQKSRKNLYLRIIEALSNSRHQWMWDEPSLIQVLSQQGFQSVRQCQYGDWSDSRFDLVEKLENYSNAIGIEAIK